MDNEVLGKAEHPFVGYCGYWDHCTAQVGAGGTQSVDGTFPLVWEAKREGGLRDWILQGPLSPQAGPKLQHLQGHVYGL